MTDRQALSGAASTWARIDLAALRANYQRACALAGGRAVIAVVKADAYGHGAVTITRALAQAGATRVAVATVGEGVELREAFPALRILVLGGVRGEAEADAAAAFGLVPVLHHEGELALVARTAGRRGICSDVQVEIDLEMRRLGVPEAEAVALLGRVAADPGLRLEGVFTHFARADESDPALRAEPLGRFSSLLGEARARGIEPGLVHTANSAALLGFDETLPALPEQDAVRPGLLLYGVRPAPHLAAELQPVMTLHSTIVALRTVEAGEAVGYGAAYRAARRTRIATLPLGYADGVPWSLADRGAALVGGRRVPFAGRVSMDLVTLDLGDEPAAIGDPVILFGVGQEAALPVEEVAAAAGTIPYEILVRIGRRVPRVVEDD